MRTLIWHVGALLLLNLLTSVAAAATRTVMLSGQAAPGTSGATFGTYGEQLLSALSINDAGQVAYYAFLTRDVGGVTDANDAGIWLNRSESTTTLVTREGSRPAGTPIGAKFSPGGPLLSESGDVAFGGTFSTSGWGEGIWLYQDGVVTNVALAGKRAPGTQNGIYFEHFDELHFSGSGRVAFSAFLTTGAGDPYFDGDYGIWTGAAGEQTSGVAREYNAMPGFPVDAQFTFSIFPMDVSRGGRITVAGVVIENSRYLGTLWSTDEAGALRLVAGGDIAVPGTPNGTRFHYFHTPHFAGDNRIVAVSLLGGEGVAITNWNDSGIWRFGLAGEPSQLIVREGDPAIGFSQAGYFGDLQQIQMHTNDAGDVVFNAYVFDQPGRGNREIGRGLWMSRYGAEPEFIDVSRLEVFGVRATDATTLYGVTGMNDRRQLVFTGQVSRTGDRPTDGHAVFVQDRGGSLRLVVRNGDEIDVDSGPGVDWRRVKEFSLPEDFFNEAGQILFSAVFDDGSSGVFVSDVGTTLLGDYNRDGSVGPEDYTAWKAAFGTTNLAADGNADGVVDAADYSVWRDNLGRSVAGGGAQSLVVPEPRAAPIACALFGAIGILVRGRRDVR